MTIDQWIEVDELRENNVPWKTIAQKFMRKHDSLNAMYSKKQKEIRAERLRREFQESLNVGFGSWDDPRSAVCMRIKRCSHTRCHLWRTCPAGKAYIKYYKKGVRK